MAQHHLQQQQQQQQHDCMGGSSRSASGRSWVSPVSNNANLSHEGSSAGSAVASGSIRQGQHLMDTRGGGEGGGVGGEPQPPGASTATGTGGGSGTAPSSASSLEPAGSDRGSYLQALCEGSHSPGPTTHSGTGSGAGAGGGSHVRVLSGLTVALGGAGRAAEAGGAGAGADGSGGGDGSVGELDGGAPVPLPVYDGPPPPWLLRMKQWLPGFLNQVSGGETGWMLSVTCLSLCVQMQQAREQTRRIERTHSTFHPCEPWYEHSRWCQLTSILPPLPPPPLPVSLYPPGVCSPQGGRVVSTLVAQGRLQGHLWPGAGPPRARLPQAVRLCALAGRHLPHEDCAGGPRPGHTHGAAATTATATDRRCRHWRRRRWGWWLGGEHGRNREPSHLAACPLP